MRSSKHSSQALFHKGASLMILVYLAYAYLEPGASSFLLKVIISALTGIIVVFRYIRMAFRALFSKSAKQSNESKEKAEDS